MFMRAVPAVHNLAPANSVARSLIGLPGGQVALQQVFVHCHRVRAHQLDRAFDLCERAFAVDRKRTDLAIGIQAK